MLVLVSSQRTKWRYRKLVILNTYLCIEFYVALFYDGSPQYKIGEKKLPYVCLCVCVCVCDNGVAFIEGI